MHETNGNTLLKYTSGLLSGPAEDFAKDGISFEECLAALLSDTCDIRTGAGFLRIHSDWLWNNPECAHQHITATVRRLQSGRAVEGRNVIGLGGTGGSGLKNRINVTSLAALILASAKYSLGVIKFGNAGNHVAGSTDFWTTALQTAAAEFTIAKAELTLAECGFAVVHAGTVIPLLEKLRPFRRAVEGPTVFNLAGPLLNPFNGRTFIGVYDARMLLPMARAMGELGKPGVVFSGYQAGQWLDELSADGTSEMIRVGEDGEISNQERVHTKSFAVGEETTLEVLSLLVAGKTQNEAVGWVLENAGFYLALAEGNGFPPTDVYQATSRLREAVQKGSVRALLARYRSLLS